MERHHPLLRRIGTTAGYTLVGVAVSVVVALGTLYATQPLQQVVYDLFYLRVGPSEATETAILAHFLTASLVALTAALVVGEYLSDRGRNHVALGKAVIGMVGLLVLFFCLGLLGLAASLTALLVLAVALVGVPVALRFHYQVRSGGVPAFLGGAPVVVFLLLLAGIGVGWGWGYVMTATEVPESSVDGPVANVSDAPAVEADLFDADNCETNATGRRECLLSLRGYDHERQAVRFMARHGVRCPHQGAVSPNATDSFVARSDGTYYRIRCSPHGD